MSRFDPPRDHGQQTYGCAPIVVVLASVACGCLAYRWSHSLLIGIVAGVVVFLGIVVGIGWSNS